MTPEKETEITRLAVEAHMAFEELRAQGMRNAALSPDEKEKQAVAYARASAKALEADRLLTNAIKS